MDTNNEVVCVTCNSEEGNSATMMMNGECVFDTEITTCDATDYPGCTECYVDGNDVPLCSDCDAESYYENFACTPLPFHLCTSAYWMCDKCLDWVADGVTLECSGCNAAGVLDGSIYEVDSKSR